MATEAVEILPGVFRWEYFSPEHKVVLTSHAVLAEGELYIFDPIELAKEACDQLLSDHRVAAIVLTNENHERSTEQWREVTKAPVWASAEAKLVIGDVRRWKTGETTWGPWRIVPLPGGAGGETALLWEARSVAVLGDAVFNLPKYGFGLLPEKYCQDQATLKESLLKLTATPIETALLAHGVPILTGASARISALVMK